jgi:hypothetical protein
MAKKNINVKEKSKPVAKVVSKVTVKNENSSKRVLKSRVTAKLLKTKKKKVPAKVVFQSKKTVAEKRKAKIKEESKVRAKKAIPVQTNNIQNNISTETSFVQPKKKKAAKVTKSSKVDISNIDLVKQPSTKVEESITSVPKAITHTEDGKEILDISKFVGKSQVPTGAPNEVILKCVQQGSKLRVRIVTKGFYNDANCQFPKNIRKVGRMYKVHVRDVVLASGSSGRYFYRVKSGITVLDDKDVTVTSIIVFEDKTDTDCAVCLCVPKTTVIVPCGHFYTCMPCAQKLDKCPICRGDIQKLIDKTSMD